MKLQSKGPKKEEKVKFPVKFDLKVIMTTQENNQDNIDLLEPVLRKLDISFGKWSHKPSGKGTYTSYSVNVRIISQEILTQVYNDLKVVPGFKMAL